jgi:hypothetical protein
VTLFTVWLAMFGLWPLADPGHSGWNLLVIIDLSVHFVATCVLIRSIRRWFRDHVTVTVKRS